MTREQECILHQRLTEAIQDEAFGPAMGQARDRVLCGMIQDARTKLTDLLDDDQAFTLHKTLVARYTADLALLNAELLLSRTP
jgi:hypothetical protein